MKVHQVNNQTTFGIEYKIPKSHSAIKKALQSNKKLVEAIDSKYKEASANFALFGNEEEDYCSLFLIHLNPQKTYRFYYNSHTKETANRLAYDHIKTLTFEEVESKAKECHEPLVNTSIKEIKTIPGLLQNFYDKMHRVMKK